MTEHTSLFFQGQPSIFGIVSFRCQIAIRQFFFAAAMITLACPSHAAAQCLGGAPDGMIGPSEACDDNNLAAGDGCSASCTIENEWSCARTVNFGNLSTNNFPGSTATWTIAGDNLSGTQNVNTSRPTIALFGENAAQGTYAVQMRVNTTSDNDFIGFAIGFQSGDQSANSADYLVVEWKQSLQSGIGPGMALLHVKGIANNGSHMGHDIPQRNCPASGTNSCVREIGRANTLSQIGWADNTTYNAYITYRPDRLTLTIDGIVEFDVSPDDFPGEFSASSNLFPDGEIGFYTHSQQNVLYRNLAPFGPSTCNITTLSDADIYRLPGSGATTIAVADYFSDTNGDNLDAAGVVVLDAPAGATTRDPQTTPSAASGTIELIPNDDTIVAGYAITYGACDDNSVVVDCDTATIRVHYVADSDGDGIADRVDPDDDNDGIADALEANFFGTVDPGADADNDDIPNWQDANYWSAILSRGSDCPDIAPSDGRCDELPTDFDADGDGLPNTIDRDSDGDGLTDALEAGASDPDGDGIPTGCLPVAANGSCASGSVNAIKNTNPATAADYINPDADGDGLADSIEAFDTNGDGVISGSEVSLNGGDADGDGLDNAVDPDASGSNPLQTPLTTSADSDQDGIGDWLETCVDGYVRGSEVCDDGDANDSNGCTNSCLKGLGISCSGNAECTGSNQCTGSPATCQPCADAGAGVTDPGCTSAGLPACDTSSGPFVCVACTADADCSSAAYCSATRSCLTPTLGLSGPSGQLAVDSATPRGTSTNVPSGSLVSVSVRDPSGATALGSCTATVASGGSWSCAADAITGLGSASGYRISAAVLVSTANASTSGVFSVLLGPCFKKASGNSCTISGGDTGICRGNEGTALTCCTGCWNGSACNAGSAIATCGKNGALCQLCDDGNACTSDSCASGTCQQSSQGRGTSCDGGAGICAGGGSAGDICLPDSDGDVLEESADLDDDNDGIPDLEEINVAGLSTDPSADSNGNTIPDYADAAILSCEDSNNDLRCDQLPRSVDQDGDGIANHLDLDADGDGVSDLIEAGGNDTNSDGRIDDFVDSDKDGLHDPLSTTPLATPDSDQDALPDFLDLDSDADGLSDAAEAGATDANGDGFPDGNRSDTNANGWDDRNEGNNALPLYDSNGDGRPDYRSPDADGDGLPDALEGWDGNADGIPDAAASGTDSNGNGLDDAFDPSCANAGECANDIIGLIAPIPNHDGDSIGLPDYRDLDADNDGILDSSECPDGAICLDSDNNGRPDYLELDSDGDGILDAVEGFDGDHDGSADRVGSGADTNRNGIDDSYDVGCATTGDCAGVIGEVAPLPDLDNDSLPDYRDADDDNDGRATRDERDDATQCPGLTTPCTPLSGGTPEDINADAVLNWYDLDSDGDGALDRAEHLGPNLGDFDNNGLLDYLDPSYQVPDTDNDGLPDPLECAPPAHPSNNDCPDQDNDGVPDYQDPDDDNDGIATQDEISGPPSGAETIPDSDGDGVANHLDLDADNDGIPDLWESGNEAIDTDKNGIVDGTPQDTDGDGILDLLDSVEDDPNITTLKKAPINSDGTGPIDAFDLDSDDDGIADIVEAGGLDDDGDGRIDNFKDDDRDGLYDPFNVSLPNGAPLPIPDTDKDDKYDYRDDDSDADGIPDLVEGHDIDADSEPDTVPSGEDINNDGLDDAFDGTAGGSPAPRPDSDADGIPNVLDGDDDGDSVLTANEMPDPNQDGDLSDAQDSDGDGTPDYLDPDDDGDSVPTRDELPDPNGDGDNLDARDSDKDGIPDYLDQDDDNDGTATGEELEDQDGNGVPDYLEARQGGITGGALCNAQGQHEHAPWLLIAMIGGLLLWVRKRRRQHHRH